ncbi:MAG: tetratricopeptide repeat protein [Deltaproteobacteria bacterium]|nr:tetratricopeptide repeat protein [Deltaproteobacteria bacterium]MBW1955597.1 tetratricopeptide repeat protein [Deltaproteobacteria bacterium]MBW2041877.1 tetratricopeptide repeat protein [Deltaproteobacteria bacterium]MBW2132093.1 tetratricopeptide repeat protein [Deltaproteobacteria bacterium]
MSKRGLFKGLCLVWIMAFTAGVSASADSGSFGPPCITADDQFAYARTLYDEGEYQEAAAEFRRFIHFFPADPRIEDAWYHTGMAWFAGGRYLNAVQAFQTLIDHFGETPLGIKSHFQISESYWKLKDPGRALIPLFNLIALIDDPSVKDSAYYRAGWIYLETAQWNKARAAFENIGPNGRESLGIAPLLTRMETRRELERKDPATAGVLAVVPGAGYLYCGRYRDALTAFIVNGLFAWAAVEAFDNDSPALGSLISAMEFGFYSGSIFGSVASARKFNENRIQRFIDTLKKEQKVSLSASFVPGSGALVARFSF